MESDSEISLISVSWMPHEPSLMLKTTSSLVLLDCAMDMEPLSVFLPCPIVSSQVPRWMKKMSTSAGVTKINSHYFLEHSPQVCPVLPESAIIDEPVDAILISNWNSFLALPFIIEKAHFEGEVYATEPTIQLGSLMMQELLSMLERVEGDGDTDSNWRAKIDWKLFPQVGPGWAEKWCSLYTREEVKSCMAAGFESLARVRTIYFREPIKLVGGLVATAYSSGYSIGSCNWLIRTNMEEIAYLSATSLVKSHVKPMDKDGLCNSDALIISSLSRHPSLTHEDVIPKLISTVMETLKVGGNVIFPIAPAGLVYDLIEHICVTMEKSSISRDTPIYFISPVAKASLAYASIFAEWLSKEREDKVYIPEEPFIHSELVKAGRVKVYENVYDDFSREMRTPCVVFTGHPSLRVGSVVHFLHLWGDDARSSIIMTDPDYQMAPFYDPFKELKIRAYYFPIDIRLDRSQLKEVLDDLKPKLVLAPENYSDIYNLHDKDLCGKSEVVYLEQGHEEELPFHQGRKRVPVDDAVLKSLEIEQKEDVDMVSDRTLIPLSASISAYDFDLKILPDVMENVAVPLKSCYGIVKVDALGDALSKRKLKYAVSSNPIDGVTSVSIKFYNAEVRILEGGRKTRINCPDPDKRRELRELVASCLEKSC